MDTFQTDVNKAKKLRSELMNHLADRENRMKNGESTGRVDANLRGGIQQMAVLVDSLHNNIEAYTADPGRYRLSQSELDKRRALVSDLESAFNEIDEQSRQVFGPNKSANVGLNFKRGEGDFETEDTKNMSNQDLKLAQKKMLEKQDEVIEGLIGTSENLVYVAKEIGDEVDLHNKLLDDVEHNVDHQNQRINNTTYKMKLLIEKSNDGCMLCCIVLLIVGIVLVLVLL
jgi:adenosyl cobinamide kinase/adenosyl cobinamide phosphate guanylyltransferase